MEAFETLLKRAKEAAIASMWLPDDTGETVDFDGLMDGVSTAIAEILPAPEDIDAEWVLTMVAARPALIQMDGVGETAAAILHVAMTDLLVDELEDELRQHVLDKGFDLDKAPTP